MRTEDYQKLVDKWVEATGSFPGYDEFHDPAIPIVLTILLLDFIGFGIVLPVLPSLIVHLGHVSLTDATRIAGYMLVAYAVRNSSPARCSGIAINMAGVRSCCSAPSPSASTIC